MHLLGGRVELQLLLMLVVECKITTQEKIWVLQAKLIIQGMKLVLKKVNMMQEIMLQKTLT